MCPNCRSFPGGGEIGRSAVQLVLDQLDREMSEWKAITRTLKTELLIRDSS